MRGTLGGLQGQQQHRALHRRERASLCVAARVTTWKDVAEELKGDYGGVIYRVPKLQKISIARSMGVQAKVEKLMNMSMVNLARITGVRPQPIIARRSIALKVQRVGHPIGVKVIIEDEEKINSFMDRLIHLALPRIRDFRGLNAESFDRTGNFHLNLNDSLMFPETKYEETQYDNPGMFISFHTTAKTPEEGLKLLDTWGLPFRPYDPEEDEQIWAEICQREKEEAERAAAQRLATGQ